VRLANWKSVVARLAQPARSTSAGQERQATPDHLWCEMDRCVSENKLDALRTLLVGFEAQVRGQLLDSFGLIDAKVSASACETRALRAQTEFWDRFDCAVINHDSFEDTETAVDAYLAFRQRFPCKVVILVSASVSGDDLGMERAAICDATLRLPVSPERLQLGVRAALTNRRTALTHRRL
jgi:hypothetical protein